METISQDQLEQIAALVADRSLSQAERESRALAVAGSPELARRALDWLPEAFGLVAIRHMEGLELPTTFSAKSLDGTWQQFPLSAEPLFAQMVRLALSGTDLFKPIAEQSSCINAVDNALNAGRDLKGAKISGPALVGVPAEIYLGQALGRTGIRA
jgi:hypothetical protein